MNRLIVAAAAAALAVIGAGAEAQKPKQPMKPPFAGGAGKDVQQTDPEVVKLEAAAAKAEKAAKAKPKDSKLKDQAADAYYKAGYACEYSKVLAPRPKYRGALKLYRKALALNPKHAKAAAEKKQIEDIYKQMGMPIPD